MFDLLVHADWSVNARKRWQATAQRQDSSWEVCAPRPVGLISAFLDEVFANASQYKTLAGFDFPLGVPHAYGMKTRLAHFQEALFIFGSDDWPDFFEVADAPNEVSIQRPFYPRNCRKGVSRSALVSGLEVESFDDLLRVCERRTAHRPAACSLFWTLGGNQAGRAAIAGWTEVIKPALQRGAALWPFDGSLAALSARPGVVLAETYPADAYRMFGAGFSQKQSKRRQSDRASKAPEILAWAIARSVHLSDHARAMVADGFGDKSSGEDAFDAFAGLLKMIEIADGRRPESTTDLSSVLRWEGWILGH